jgi:hypothetical protein
VPVYYRYSLSEQNKRCSTSVSEISDFKWDFQFFTVRWQTVCLIYQCWSSVIQTDIADFDITVYKGAGVAEETNYAGKFNVIYSGTSAKHVYVFPALTFCPLFIKRRAIEIKSPRNL